MDSKPQLGRPRIAPEITAEIRRRLMEGEKPSAIAEAVGVSTVTVYAERRLVAALKRGDAAA